MKTVWKYELSLADGVQVLSMPVGSTIVKVDTQVLEADATNEIQLWAEVNTSAPTEMRGFIVVGTGHPVQAPSTYIGTALTYSKKLVFHVFEID